VGVGEGVPVGVGGGVIVSVGVALRSELADDDAEDVDVDERAPVAE
jgi:hypothetical protein